MERRFILAVVLSLLVLYIWTLTTPRPEPSAPGLSDTQVVVNKKDADYSSAGKAAQEASGPDIEQITAIPSPIPPSPETIKKLESSKLLVKFTNIGGTIKSVKVKDYETSLPLTQIAGLAAYKDREFRVLNRSSDRIVYVFENQDYRILKSYQLSLDDYSIQSDITIQNKSSATKTIDVSMSGFYLDMSNLEEENGFSAEARDKSLFEYIVYTDKGLKRKNNAHKFSLKEREEELQPVNWVGFRNRYFCAIVKPQFDSTAYFINPIDEQVLAMNIESRSVKLPYNGSITLPSLIYVGPEKLEHLKEFDLEFEKIRKYYRFGLFDAIAKLIYNIMYLTNKVIPNWGVCIILISVLIYFSMYPLTLKGMESMKRMQSLQPKITALKERYKNSPEKMNKEMMGLYKEHKINPLGGCLPLLLQMPVFIGLYQVLWRSVSLKGAKFLWIDDLSAPDRLFILPFKLPFLGNELNLLPIIMIVVMFVQQKISSKNMKTTDPVQLQQQKMMTTIMPIFLGVIFYKFASGLTLYFTMFYLFSTFTQWKMSKKTEPA